MIIYLSGLLASLVLVGMAIKCKPEKVIAMSYRGRRNSYDVMHGLLIIISASPLIIISALRENVGTDFGGYVEIFEKISNSDRTYVEYGYFLINKVVYLLGIDYRGVFIISSLLIGVLIYFAIYNLSENITLSVILYVITINYFNSMNIVRQYIALAIFLFGLKYVKEKNFIKYIICVLAASLFHKSLLLGFAIYFFQYIKLSKKNIVIILTMSAGLLPWVKKYIWEIFSSTYYEIYLSDKYLNSFSMTYACINIFILLLAFYFYNRLKSQAMYRTLLNIHICSVVVTIYSGIIPLAYRILWSLSLTNILFVPMLLQCIKKVKNRLLAQTAIISIYAVFTFLTICMKTYNDVIPYKSVLSNWLSY